MSGPRVLLVMHNAPIESTFLAAKVKELSKQMDIHVLFWDTEERINTFIKENQLQNYSDKIHRGISKVSQATLQLYKLLILVFTKKNARRYILSGDGSFTKRLKFILYYLPVFFVKPDIIHFEFGTLATDIELLKQLTRAKTIVSFRGYDLNYVGLNDTLYYASVWKHTEALHFLGKDLKQRAIGRGYKNDKIEAIINPAVNVELFKKTRTNHADDILRIVSVGRLTWKKGYEYAVQALSKLKEQQVPFEYTIIGDGPHRQAIEYTIYELGLQNVVRLTGNQTIEQISTALSTSDIFLHPALSEGFCNAVIEAQAAGLTVICSDADGLKENIEDGVTGFVVPKWDVKAISEKLLWAYNKKPLLKAMGENGRKRANEKYKIEEQVKRFVDFYKKVYES